MIYEPAERHYEDALTLDTLECAVVDALTKAHYAIWDAFLAERDRVFGPDAVYNDWINTSADQVLLDLRDNALDSLHVWWKNFK